jgi:hypothetical protein
MADPGYGMIDLYCLKSFLAQIKVNFLIDVNEKPYTLDLTVNK